MRALGAVLASAPRQSGARFSDPGPARRAGRRALAPARRPSAARRPRRARAACRAGRLDRPPDRRALGRAVPGSAKPVLQGYVSNLRKAIGREVLVTRAPGYALELEPDQLDLHRFERLLGEGSAVARRAGRAPPRPTLREALALWRGPALADLAYEPFAQAAIVRLEELRLAALEERIEADLALGRHAQLVGELEALVARAPAARAPARPADARALPLGPPGGGARGLPAGAAHARRGARDRPEPGAPGARAGDPAAGSGARPHGDAGAATRPAAVRRRRPRRSARSSSSRWDEAISEALLALAAPLARRPPARAHPRRARRRAGGCSARPRLAPGAAGRARRRTGSRARRGVRLRARRRGRRAARLRAERRPRPARRAPGELVEGVRRATSAPSLEHAPCDVGVLVTRDGAASTPGPGRPVLVPFGGADHDWTAAEIGAWIAGALGAPLRLLGTTADAASGRRDASRLLANAVARPAGRDRHRHGAPARRAGRGRRDRGGGRSRAARRRALRPLAPGGDRGHAARRGHEARPPTLLVRRGLRPGGLAPRESLTRFTWTLAR